MTAATNLATRAKDSPQEPKETSHAHPVRYHCRGHSRSPSLGKYFNRYETVRRFDLANLTAIKTNLPKLTYKGDCFDDSLAALISCRLKLDWQVPSRFARDHPCALACMAKRLRLQSARQ